ncbi:MAG TPA: hypothetical protein V6D19_01050, partial [Stenomitos sp.]
RSCYPKSYAPPVEVYGVTGKEGSYYVVYAPDKGVKASRGTEGLVQRLIFSVERTSNRCKYLNPLNTSEPLSKFIPSSAAKAIYKMSFEAKIKKYGYQKFKDLWEASSESYNSSGELEMIVLDKEEAEALRELGIKPPEVGGGEKRIRALQP